LLVWKRELGKSKILQNQQTKRVFKSEQGLSTSITSNSFNLVTPTGTKQITIQVYVIVNGYQVKALFNRGTIGDYLIPRTYVFANRITTKNIVIPISTRSLSKKGDPLSMGK
jgi:hypothetical protein